MLTIILISIFAVVFVGALAALYHSLSGKAEEEDMLEQVARLARAQERLNTRLEELESDTAGGNAALDQMFLAGINGIMNYGMKDAVKRG